MRSIAQGLRWIANHPIESIVFVLATGLFLYFVYFVSPFYVSSYTSALEVGISRDTAEVLFGLFFMLTTLPGVISPFMHNLRWRRWSANLLMMDFFFLALIRILVFGWFPAVWLTNFLVSICCLIISLYLRAGGT